MTPQFSKLRQDLAESFHALDLLPIDTMHAAKYALEDLYERETDPARDRMRKAWALRAKAMEAAQEAYYAVIEAAYDRREVGA